MRLLVIRSPATGERDRAIRTPPSLQRITPVFCTGNSLAGSDNSDILNYEEQPNRWRGTNHLSHHDWNDIDIPNARLGGDITPGGGDCVERNEWQARGAWEAM